MKNPPSSFMVDSFEKGFLKFMKHFALSFIQDGLQLWIPIQVDSNIAYVIEMTDDEIEAMNERLEKQKEKARELLSKLVKPAKTFPSTRH